jgi:hypothetical protein
LAAALGCPSIRHSGSRANYFKGISGKRRQQLEIRSDCQPASSHGWPIIFCFSNRKGEDQSLHLTTQKSRKFHVPLWQCSSRPIEKKTQKQFFSRTIAERVVSFVCSRQSFDTIGSYFQSQTLSDLFLRSTGTQALECQAAIIFLDLKEKSIDSARGFM